MTAATPRARPLAARLGVAVPDDLVGELRATLEDTRVSACAELAVQGLAPPDAERSPFAALTLPASVAEVLALTIAEAEAAGLPEHARALSLHYLEGLPRARLEQLLTTSGPAAWLFHTPAPWSSMPRLVSGLERLFALLSTHGLDPARALGATSAEALLARHRTLAELYSATYYGRLLPMFQAFKDDLAALWREVGEASPEARWAAVDQRLATAIQHEILHFRPSAEAIFPPYLAEAFAGHIGWVIDRWVACPEPGRDDAVVGWAWFAQVGEAFARAFGDGALVAGQSGLLPWREALPAALVDACERLGWEAYRAHRRVDFHPDTTRPDRWARLAYAARRGLDVDRLALADLDRLAAPDLYLPPDPARDHAMLVNALEAACTASTLVASSWRVTRRPPDGPVVVDPERGVLAIPPRAPTSGAVTPTLYALPPVPLRATTVVIEDASPPALEAVATRLLAR